MLSNVDWTKRELLILPFDHRGTFLYKMFNIKGRKATLQEVKAICEFKSIVYDGFKKAIALGVPENIACLLVDEEFGAHVLRDAKKRGFMFAMACEKSGQKEFDFEYGGAFYKHIEKFSPLFSKVLVRFNPSGDAEMNKRQLAKLKKFGDYLKESNRVFLFELLVPATSEQLAFVNGDKHKYDRELLPSLMVESMQIIQEAGIWPDVWKVEGVEKTVDAVKIVKQAQAVGKAGVIVLGRDESKEKVQEWLKIGARTPGVIGFAIGRTIFWEALVAFKTVKCNRKQAVDLIARNYFDFVQLWLNEKKKSR